MGQVTATAQVWTPDANDLNEPDVYLATMAASIEDGIGQRVTKLESFVGCNLSLASGVTYTGTTITTVPFIVTSSWNFAEGVTANPDGSVVILTSGIYQINFNANWRGTSTTPPRLNTYLYNGSQSLAYSSTYGESDTSRYSNCNVAGVYKLVAGDVITARAAVADSNAVLQPGGGSGLSLALTSRS